MPENLYNSYSLEKTSTNGEVITSGSITTWSNSPVSGFEVGDTFRPVANGPLLTVKKVNINDNVIGTRNGKPFRQWQITVEGNNEEDGSSESEAKILYNFNFNAGEHTGTMEVTNEGDAPILSIGIGDTFRVPGIGNITCVNVRGSDSYDDKGNHIWTVTYEGSDASDVSQEDKYNFSIEGTNSNDSVQSGSISVVSQAERPHLDFSIGGKINVPGIGEVICTKINGSDAYDDNGNRIWTVTYEGVSSIEEQDDDDDELPQVKYSFALDKDGASSVSSGTMQVVNKGNTPALNIAVGSKFRIPGIGDVTCTKITGNDDYTENGTRRWTVIYEGSTASEDSSEQPQDDDNNVKYTFNVEDGSDGSAIHSGTKQVILFEDSPTFNPDIGQSFNIPGIGSVTCTKYTGSDEFTDDGRHKWTIIYEGTDAPNESDDGEDDSLPENKYNLSFEKDSDGLIQKSGSMSVVTSGNAPPTSLQVGSTFNIPGIGEVTCSKISGSDDYTEDGTHRWTMTYEGYVKSSESGDDDPQNPDDQDTKYSFYVEKNSDDELVHSGSVEISTIANNPPETYQVGSTINIPGIGDVTIVKVSGSDTYTENGRRKWVMVYEASDSQDDSSSPDDPNEYGTKYSFDIENNSDGTTIYTGTKEFYASGENASAGISIGGTFDVPIVGTLTCTKIRGYKDEETGLFSFIIEGSRSSSQSDDPHDDSGLPDSEETVSYELNGSTVRSVSGELIALRKSETPITKKTFTLYNNSNRPTATLGSLYRGGIALSENIIKETIKNNGVVTSSYYKHTIEIEGEGILVDDDLDDGGNDDS